MDIESEEGTVIVSHDAFGELKKLDETQRRGWLAVLARALAGPDAAISHDKLRH